MKKCPRCDFEFDNDSECQICGYVFDGEEQEVVTRSNSLVICLALVFLAGVA